MADIPSPPTSPRLLRMLGLPGSDDAWETFITCYGPLIEARCQRAGLQPADTEDVRAIVCAQLVQSMRGFQYDPARRFRGYLQTVVENAIRTHWRILQRRPGWVGKGGGLAEDLPEPLASLGVEIDEQIQARLESLLRAAEQVRSEVEPETWQAFQLTALEGFSGSEAAERLGKTPAAIYVAKSRVLARIRARANESRRDEGTPPRGHRDDASSRG